MDNCLKFEAFKVLDASLHHNWTISEQELQSPKNVVRRISREYADKLGQNNVSENVFFAGANAANQETGSIHPYNRIDRQNLNVFHALAKR